ncbi:hypothetical protein VNO80_01122 [Phaseolus coccineus]|uniref:Uncharacterized protein n=1 Tax=Phaseolus coccineus TaxID=3886 RepID=A0AAN9P4J3_PHACN
MKALNAMKIVDDMELVNALEGIDVTWLDDDGNGVDDDGIGILAFFLLLSLRRAFAFHLPFQLILVL